MTMSKNIFLLVWIAFMYIVTTQAGVYRIERVCGVKKYRPTWFFAILVFAPIIWEAAHRGYFADTTMYIKVYREIPIGLASLIKHTATIEKDQGFTFLSGLIKMVVHEHTTIYLGIIAIIQAAALIAIFRKYSSNYIISIFLFVASTDYVSWMFNGLRQFTAVTLIFAATGLMIKKKWIPTILVILLASTMHQSALLMIPVVFLVQGKAWNGWTLLCLLGAMLAVLFVDQFTDILDNMMQETQYSNMVSDWEEWEDDGTNILRVAVYAVPTILSLIGLRYIRSEGDLLINICTNMSILSTALYVISMFTSGVFIGRLPIYMSLYNYILLPWEVKHMFTRQSQKIVMLCMVGGYLLFNLYQIKFAWGL